MNEQIMQNQIFIKSDSCNPLRFDSTLDFTFEQTLLIGCKNLRNFINDCNSQSTINYQSYQFSIIQLQEITIRMVFNDRFIQKGYDDI